jgi:hypothetical protein
MRNGPDDGLCRDRAGHRPGHDERVRGWRRAQTPQCVLTGGPSRRSPRLSCPAIPSLLHGLSGVLGILFRTRWLLSVSVTR